MKQLVVIGTGMSAMKVVDELLNIDPLKYQITMIGGEKGLPYNRIMLSPVLAGEKSFTDIITHNAEYFAQNNITFNDNTWVNEIDRGAKKITTTHRETKEQHTLHYDKKVILFQQLVMVVRVLKQCKNKQVVAQGVGGVLHLPSRFLSLALALKLSKKKHSANAPINQMKK
jgi:nitrite reductase (NADH) large subunit